MDKNEPFIHSEVKEETPKQSPQSSQMDKTGQSRFQLSSPVTPKTNHSISNAKSLQDEGILGLMNGLLVTSATGKNLSDSTSSLCSLGRSSRSSAVVRVQHENTESNPPRIQTGRNQETTRSQISSGKMLAENPSTKAETPKAVHQSKLRACAAPFTPARSSQILASPVPPQQQQLQPLSNPYPRGPAPAYLRLLSSPHGYDQTSMIRIQTGRNQETSRSQISSGGKGKMLAESPSTKAETPKAVYQSKLQASAEPFIVAPRSTLQQLPFDNGPHFQVGETSRSQISSGGKGKMLAESPSTKAETPKAVHQSKLRASAAPFIPTPRSTLQQLPLSPHFQGGNPPQQQQLPPSYGHPYMSPTGHDFPLLSGARQARRDRPAPVPPQPRLFYSFEPPGEALSARCIYNTIVKRKKRKKSRRR